MKGTVVMAYRYGGESIVALQILRILRILPQHSSGVVFTPPFHPLVVRRPCERLMVWSVFDKDCPGTSAFCGFPQ